MSNFLLKRVGLSAIFFSFFWAASVAHAGPESVDVHLTQSKIVVGKDGKESVESADTSLPGDIIEYKIVYTNKGKDDVKGLAASLPIPAGVRFTGVLTPSKTYFASLDGKKFNKAPLTKKVKQPDGTEKVVPVPYDEYRALRWPLGVLKASKSEVVTARIQVNPLGSATTPLSTSNH